MDDDDDKDNKVTQIYILKHNIFNNKPSVLNTITLRQFDTCFDFFGNTFEVGVMCVLYYKQLFFF